MNQYAIKFYSAPGDPGSPAAYFVDDPAGFDWDADIRYCTHWNWIEHVSKKRDELAVQFPDLRFTIEPC